MYSNLILFFCRFINIDAMDDLAPDIPCEARFNGSLDQWFPCKVLSSALDGSVMKYKLIFEDEENAEDRMYYRHLIRSASEKEYTNPIPDSDLSSDDEEGDEDGENSEDDGESGDEKVTSDTKDSSRRRNTRKDEKGKLHLF
jgi:hypothetical protein